MKLYANLLPGLLLRILDDDIERMCTVMLGFSLAAASLLFRLILWLVFAVSLILLLTVMAFTAEIFRMPRYGLECVELTCVKNEG